MEPESREDMKKRKSKKVKCAIFAPVAELQNNDNENIFMFGNNQYVCNI